jgi:hypothetical protein
MLKYLTVFVILTIVGILYDRYKLKNQQEDNLQNYDIVRKYLLNDNALTGGKPIIWVHVDYEINARNWLSFGSRNSKQLNQPYLYITIQSIINNCGNDFNVCLIDDESFTKLLPGWNIDIPRLANPVKTHMRSLALSKILYYYGGILVPNSYVALKNLQNIYDIGMKYNSCFVVETIDRGNTATLVESFPNHTFMGCVKQCKIMKQFMLYLEQLNSTDYTNESDFLGQANRWCYEQVLSNKMGMIDGKLIGCKTETNKPVYLDNLLQSSYIDFDKNLQGIYIPSSEILRRTKYQWFARLSPEQIYTANVILSKYLLVTNNV